ncbi:MAG: glycoside hydrolase family 6 protein [Candidatus Sericytochromatia bacterium]|nr:glycoside hydrolase family 6 protein [Candidatus Tanganyikabacteria bacterium]
MSDRSLSGTQRSSPGSGFGPPARSSLLAGPAATPAPRTDTLELSPAVQGGGGTYRPEIMPPPRPGAAPREQFETLLAQLKVLLAQLESGRAAGPPAEGAPPSGVPARRRLPAGASFYSDPADPNHQTYGVSGSWWLVQAGGQPEDIRRVLAGAKARGDIPVFTQYTVGGRDREPGLAHYLRGVETNARAIGPARAIVVIEPDALPGNLNPGAIRQAVELYRRHAPEALVYIDAGHSYWRSADDMVKALVAAGIRDADGFSLNVSNFQWTDDVMRYGDEVVAKLAAADGRLAGKQYVVDTSRNGNGPGVDESGKYTWGDPIRAINGGTIQNGPFPTTATGNPNAAAFLWVKPPGVGDDRIRPATQFGGRRWVEPNPNPPRNPSQRPAPPIREGAAPSAPAAGNPSPRPEAPPPGRFQLGANLPWLRYGGDFGGTAWDRRGVSDPARQAEAAALLDRLKADGAEHVRWWLLADGRGGVRFGPDGTPLGLDPQVFADMDAAVRLAKERGMRIQFSLLDFHWLAPAETISGVTKGGHADTFADPRKRKALIDNVLTPLFRRYAGESTIASWDLMNEPEWQTREVGGKAGEGVDKETLRAYVREAAAAAHAAGVLKVTVGSASTRYLDLVKGLGLDEYQAHWYDHFEGDQPLGRDVAAYGLDKPLVLGEFPTRGTGKDLRTVLDTARNAGMAGAWLWSANAGDAYSDYPATRNTLRDWAAANLAEGTA